MKCQCEDAYCVKDGPDDTTISCQAGATETRYTPHGKFLVCGPCYKANHMTDARMPSVENLDPKVASAEGGYITHKQLELEHNLRRKCRRAIASFELLPQTFRAWVTLECGHKDTFTMSAEYMAKHPRDWHKRKRECRTCAKEAARKQIEEESK